MTALVYTGLWTTVGAPLQAHNLLLATVLLYIRICWLQQSQFKYFICI